MRRRSVLAGTAIVATVAAALLCARPVLTQVAGFDAPEAGQGVAVDAHAFYAVNDTILAKYDKKTGARLAVWAQEPGGPLIHLDGAMVMDGRIYAAHSNYPAWPMTSSLEIFDADTLAHVGSHSFGINWGSLTWVDYRDGFWWMMFANYDQPVEPNGSKYGDKRNTQLIKFTPTYQMVEAWTLPRALLDRFDMMSSSGGSWGPDGFLYLTGHDRGELYKMRLPAAGSVLELVATIPINIRGQGIAWDRSTPGVIYGVVRATTGERGRGIPNKVVAFRLDEEPAR